jgi:phenylalanyl-tRNA synthetase beta chain
MKVDLGWLSEWIDLPSSVGALVDRLTFAGLEIEGIERTGPDLAGIRVGHVVERRQHPNADRLSLCRVDLGDGEPIDIVCGAPNVASDQKVAVALSGMTLPDGTKLKKSKIRGVVSNGMICSERELALSDEHEGILVLETDAPPGTPLCDVLPAGDAVLDVEITPNRGDWASILGIAREVRAHFGGELRVPSCETDEDGAEAADAIQIEIEDGAGCHRYAGRVVRGIRVGPSPEWVRRKLEASGLRSINNVVDVTNLVLLEFGQPLHAFDLPSLRGERVIVRRARKGEKLATLDGQTRELDADDLVIADAERAIAVAGVMGGAETEVREPTTDILIESAHFDPSSVRRTARRLGLSTDASYRFERGVDRDGIERAADRCARLIAELAGGAIAPGRVVALGNAPPATLEVELDPERANRLLGTSLSTEDTAAILGRADLPATQGADGRLVCRVPSYRNDVHAPEDLIEEVARVYGYEAIPTTLPEGKLSEVHAPRTRPVLERARDSLCASGLVEIMCFPVQQAADPERLRLDPSDPRARPLRLENPIAEDEAGMRTSLVPTVLRTVRLNLSRQAERVRVFEAGNAFLPRGPGELPDERLWVVAAITAGEGETLWDATGTAPLFFEAKGIVEQLLTDLRIEATLVPGAPEPYLHPGESNAIVVGSERIGSVGKLHPETAARFEIDVPCALLELELERLPELPQRPIRYREVSRQPRVRRDLAYLFERDRPAGELIEAIRKTGGGSLVSVALFDRYEGKGIPEGKVSLGFRLVFQRPDRTLTDSEVNKQMDRVERMLAGKFEGVRR